MGRFRVWLRQIGPEAPRREPVRQAARPQAQVASRPPRRSFNEAAHKQGR
jgi:hypothetical protein